MNMISAVARSDIETERVRPASRIGAALSWEEQGAVLASLTDGTASIGTGAFGRVLRAFFGLRPAAPLAGERLEALRRYAVLYRLKGAVVTPKEEARLLRSGFCDRQAEEARALVDAHATYRRERAYGGGRLIAAILLALAAAAILFVYQWLARQVDDRLGALIITIMLVTWIVSISVVTSHPHRRI